MILLRPFGQAKRRLERLVQRIVVRTNFPPFSWCYALYYRLVLRVSVAALRGIPEVVSIYLTGGLSRGRISYGLSDIDIMVFIHEGGESSVRRRCELLRFFFPILPAREVGVFNADDLERLLRKDSHLAYRLLYAPVPARLLHGPSLTDGHAPGQRPRRAAEALIGRFEFLWNILLHRLIHMPPALGIDRDYLYAKLSRQLREELPRDPGQAAPEPVPAMTDPSEVYLLGRQSLLQLGRYCAAAVPALGLPPPGIDLQALHLTMGSQTRDALERFVEWLLGQYAGVLQSVMVSPACVLPITERELSLFMIERHALELKDVRRILEAAETAGLRDRIDLNLMSRDIAFSVNLQDLSWSVFSPLTRAATFLYLASPECVLYGRPLDSLLPVCDLRAIAREAKQEIRDCIDGQVLTRLTPLAFQEITWQCLQAASILEMGLFPLTSAQVCCRWQEHPGLDWLASLHQQYPADLDGRPSQTERFFQRGITLVRNLTEHQNDEQRLAS